MKKGSRVVLISILLFLFTFLGKYAVVASEEAPILTYQGANGVEIRSYVPSYTKEKLQWIYNEFTKNTMGEEIAYLSHINLYPDYIRGKHTVGMWHGEWINEKLSPGRYIDLYGVGDDNPYYLLTLAHEYGHHFLYYYVNKKEGHQNDLLSSNYAKIRGLNQYEELNKGEHQWAASEIAADDYVQLFGSPALAQNSTFQYSPQENTAIPLAWEVPGLYEYFVELSGLQGKADREAPAKPLLEFLDITPQELIFSWQETTDDSAEPLIYTTVGVTYPEKGPQLNFLMNTTKNNHEFHSALNRNQLSYYNVKKVLVKLVVMDQSGNAVSSEVMINLHNPEESFTYIFPGQRIGGENRYQTSAAISQAAYPDGSSYAILVTGQDFPDALSAAPLAKKYNAPILLTPTEALDPDIAAEIDRLGTTNILIIGGTGVVSQGIEHTLNAHGISTRRIAGASRYETSLSIAEELGDFQKIFVCNGENFPDALSAAAVAANEGIPILLTPANELQGELAEFINRQELTQTYVVGGAGVISNQVFDQLPQAKRLSGSDRYETNLAILEEFGSTLTGDTAYLATGMDYPDALSCSVLAAERRSPMLLIGSGESAKARAYLRAAELVDQKVQVIGGDSVVSNSLLKGLFD
ncbi:MAG: cell wall-binding repeat-containing protein [Desulfitobacterium sp.]